jgi:hypothetical protein
MIARKEIHANRVLSLAWKSGSSTKTCKRGFIFEKGVFLVGLSKGTKLLRTIKKTKQLEVRINGSSQKCRAKIVDEFKLTKALLKKEMERLMGRKLNPNSKSAKKLDEIAARHVVVELKPIKG